MISPFTFDTNILIYSTDPTDVRKHLIADQIVDSVCRSGHQIPLQCLTEFYRASTKKRILQPKAAEDVVLQILHGSRLISPNEEDILHAIKTHQNESMQFFDALLLATATRSGCTMLFSEDFQHGRTYGSITVQNPFLLSDPELSALLA